MKHYLLWIQMILLSLHWGCVDQTDPAEVVSIEDQSVYEENSNYCVGPALNRSPFANSGAGGDGLSRRTAFRICTADQLNAIGSNSGFWNKYFVLDSDISLASIGSFNMIGTATIPFTGIFDGKNHSVSSLRLFSGLNDSGFFRKIEAPALVSRVRFYNVSVAGGSRTGVVVGHQAGGTIRNVDVEVNSVSGLNDIGGMVGRMEAEAIITDSKVEIISSLFTAGGSVFHAGGIVGMMNGGVVSNVGLTARAISGAFDVGGAVGELTETAFLREVTVDITGSINGFQNVAGVAGQNDGAVSNVTVKLKNISASTSPARLGGAVGFMDGGTLSYAKVEANGLFIAGGETGGAVGFMKSGTVTDTDVTISLDHTITLAGGTFGGLIGRVGEDDNNQKKFISDVEVNINADFELANGSYIGGLVGFVDADLEARNVEINLDKFVTSDSYIGGAIGGTNVGDPTEEVEVRYENFTITIDGTIEGDSYVGGFIGQGGTGLYLRIKVTGERVITDPPPSTTIDYVGGFAGNISPITVATVEGAQVAFTEKVMGRNYIGGFMGSNSNTDIIGSFAKVQSVEASGSFIGGFVGTNTGGNVVNSYAVMENYIVGVSEIGGLLGYSNLSNIVDSYAVSQAISATTVNAGGLVGQIIDSNVAGNFSSTSVYGNSSLENVGFVIGQKDSDTTYSDNYALSGTGNVCQNGVSGKDCNLALAYETLVTDPTCDPLLVSCEIYFHNSANPPMSSWDYTNYFNDADDDYPYLSPL